MTTKQKNKNQTLLYFYIFSGILAAIICSSIIAKAAGLDTLINGILGTIIQGIAEMIVGLFQSIANFFLNAMTLDLDKVGSYLKGFEKFSDAIVLLGVVIASVSVSVQMFITLWGPMTGAKLQQTPMVLAGKALIFIPLTFIVKKLALKALASVQTIYKAFIVVDDPSGGSVNVCNEMLGIANNLKGSATNGGVLGELAAGASTIMGVLLASIVLIIVLWNFIKLLLETVQRFLALIVYAYLSPLATACGVGANSISITKQAFSLFFSSSVLWVLNVWSVGVALSIISQLGTDTTPIGLFIWCCVSYGFIKVAQQLDDIFNAVGANNVRLSGSMLGDMLELKNAGNLYNNFREGTSNFAKNGAFGSKGTQEKPVGAQQRKLDIGNSAMSQRNTEYKPARSFSAQTVDGAKKVAGGTLLGEVARGTAKTAQNIKNNSMAVIDEAKAFKSEAQLKNNFVSALKNKDVNSFLNDNPGALSNPALQKYAESALKDAGMLNKNDTLQNLTADSSGNLQAVAKSSQEDGSYQIKELNGVNEALSTGLSPIPNSESLQNGQYDNINDIDNNPVPAFIENDVGPQINAASNQAESNLSKSSEKMGNSDIGEKETVNATFKNTSGEMVQGTISKSSQPDSDSDKTFYDIVDKEGNAITKGFEKGTTALDIANGISQVDPTLPNEDELGINANAYADARGLLNVGESEKLNITQPETTPYNKNSEKAVDGENQTFTSVANSSGKFEQNDGVFAKAQNEPAIVPNEASYISQPTQMQQIENNVATANNSAMNDTGSNYAQTNGTKSNGKNNVDYLDKESPTTANYSDTTETKQKQYARNDVGSTANTRFEYQPINDTAASFKYETLGGTKDTASLSQTGKTDDRGYPEYQVRNSSGTTEYVYASPKITVEDVALSVAGIKAGDVSNVEAVQKNLDVKSSIVKSEKTLKEERVAQEREKDAAQRKKKSYVPQKKSNQQRRR